MKFIICLIFIILFTPNTYSKVEDKLVSRFGFVSQSRILSDFRDARDSLSNWIEDIGNKNNVKLDVKFFQNSDIVYKKFLANELDMIVLPLPYYFENRKEINTNAKDFWTLSFSENKFTQYYLITQKNSKNKSFKDINNKVISIKEFDQVAEIWFDKNSLIENKKGYLKLIQNLIKEEKESTVVLDVFFKKSQLGIVSKKTWDIMVELNPAIEKNIDIIKKSEKIHLPFVGIFNNNSSKEMVDTFFILTGNLKKLYNSNEMLDLLKFDSIFSLDKDSLIPLEVYYDEYFALKKKYD